MIDSIPWPALFEAAESARQKAYAPYSHFLVGAAVLTADGSIYSGANVENASYGLALCAERNAIARAVLEGQRQFVALALAVNSQVPTPPCGMCRQTMAEFAGGDLQIRSRTPGGEELKTTLGVLLPHAFTSVFLGEGGA